MEYTITRTEVAILTSPVKEVLSSNAEFVSRTLS